MAKKQKRDLDLEDKIKSVIKKEIQKTFAENENEEYALNHLSSVVYVHTLAKKIAKEINKEKN